MKVFALGFLFSLVSCGSGTMAQMEGNPDSWCREGFFTRDSKEFRIGKVEGPKNTRAFFYEDESARCPDAATCRKKAYMVPGNEVVVNRVRSEFACAWYAPAKGSPTVGWIKLSEISISEPSIAGGTREWLGEWTYADNGIKFTDNKLRGYLNVTGDATWRGIGDNVHVGEIDGRYEPVKGVIDYSDGKDEFDCRMTMRLLGTYLIVADNLKCGGVNVTFSGVYTKRRKL